MPIYVRINGIEGDVTAKGFEKWIEANSIRFAVERNVNTKPGSVANRESTKPSLTAVILTKYLDKASPHLFNESCVGKDKTVQISVCRTGETISSYLEYNLANVIVSFYQVSVATNSSGSLVPVEEIQLNFGKIEMKYIPYNQKNQPGSPIPAGYDLATAAKI